MLLRDCNIWQGKGLHVSVLMLLGAALLAHQYRACISSFYNKASKCSTVGAALHAGLSLYNVEAAAISKDKQKGKKKASKAARAGLLFTHRGYSGPAVLDLSHHAVMAAQRGTDKPGSVALHSCMHACTASMLLLLLCLQLESSVKLLLLMLLLLVL